MRLIGVSIACAGVLLSLTAAHALPKRIIILRHAEKTADKPLCDTGEKRAEALIQYLGSAGGRNSLFKAGEQPAAFYANSHHAELTLKPAAAQWQGVELHKRDISDEDTWSRNAAKKVLSDAKYNGKIVVMAWEHHRIADAKLDEENKDNPLTLYRLLGVFNYNGGIVDGKDLSNWCGSTYDFFWIVDYDPDNPNSNNGAPTPKNIDVRQQAFDKPYDNLPTNAWGAPETPWDMTCHATPEPECQMPH